MRRKEKVYIIIRHNPVTGHRYVLTDGHNGRVFQDAASAELEAKHLQGWNSAHGVEIHGCFKNTKQASEYCRLMGQGLDEASAIQLATGVVP